MPPQEPLPSFKLLLPVMVTEEPLTISGAPAVEAEWSSVRPSKTTLVASWTFKTFLFKPVATRLPFLIVTLLTFSVICTRFETAPSVERLPPLKFVDAVIVFPFKSRVKSLLPIFKELSNSTSFSSLTVPFVPTSFSASVRLSYPFPATVATIFWLVVLSTVTLLPVISPVTVESLIFTVVVSAVTFPFISTSVNSKLEPSGLF